MVIISEQFKEVITACSNSTLGKHLPSAFYLHKSALSYLPLLLQEYEQQGRCLVEAPTANLIKFSLETPKISYLSYDNFDCDPHPVLKESWLVDLETGTLSYWDYRHRENPPILHRKETFVSPDYPLYQEFKFLTQQEENLGLLENSHFIGTKQNWQARLKFHGIAIVGHILLCPLNERPSSLTIERHRAALVRKTLSRPVRLALEAGLFTPEGSFFDYGCGYGGDVERLTNEGIYSEGWDPFYAPETPWKMAKVVNLGYVINVIEEPQERAKSLENAWSLTEEVLIVAAQILVTHSFRGMMVYGDGVITRRNTFQKYYQQEELKNYIDQTLQVDAIPVDLGIYFVFKNEKTAQAFCASLSHSSVRLPRIKTPLQSFADYQEMLLPLMQFVTDRGRLPVRNELKNEAELKAEFRTFARAWNVILQVTQLDDWDLIYEQRRQDLLLYLALSLFKGRPSSRSLHRTTREDIRSLFGSYEIACKLADLMLFKLRDIKNLADLSKSSIIGQKYSHSLLIHITALDSLPTLLRLYEGCASATIGRPNEVNVIRFSFNKPQISYLTYPNFDQEAHPILKERIDICINTLAVTYQDFVQDDNPPILHEKDLLVKPDYPHYKTFHKLTEQERIWGLLEEKKKITHWRDWLQYLQEHCATIRGHQVRWRKDADPYRVKILKSQIYQRQKALNNEGGDQ